MMKLEAFLLRSGPEMLAELISSFNVQDVALQSGMLVPKWFMAFVSPLDRAWLGQINVALIQRFWRLFKDTSIRKSAIDLMAKLEWNDDYKTTRPWFSAIIGIFRAAQPDASKVLLSEEAQLIVDVSFTRAKLIAPARLSGSLGDYMLRVLRFCFVDQEREVTDEDTSRILSLGGELTSEQRARFERIIRLIP
ncbi:MAG: hypothetical protein WB676_02215 [Bryobacteraceae bacterium]